MANYGNYDLPFFQDDIPSIKEFLRISLNIIFYHRWLGETNFEDTESSFPNISYIKLNNDALQKIIESKIEEIGKILQKNNKAQVILNFYQKRESFLFKTELVGLWESWKFLFEVKKEEDINEQKNDSEKENTIRKYIFDIIGKLNDKFDFMPDFNVEDVSKLPKETFPYEIIIKSDLTDSDFINLLKNLSSKVVNKDDAL